VCIHIEESFPHICVLSLTLTPSLSISLSLSFTFVLCFTLCLSLPPPHAHTSQSDINTGYTNESERESERDSHSLIYTHAHTHTHTHDTHGAAWVQVLCKEGGMPLIMCVNNNGTSCLSMAAQNGHAAATQVGAGGGRQREAGGRVWAEMAHGTWCRGCRQHTATRGTTLQHTAAGCSSLRSS